MKIRVMPSSSMQTISWSTRLGDLPPFGESKGSDINYGKGGAKIIILLGKIYPQNLPDGMYVFLV